MGEMGEMYLNCENEAYATAVEDNDLETIQAMEVNEMASTGFDESTAYPPEIENMSNAPLNSDWYEEEPKKEISIADVTAKIKELREADTKAKASKKQHEADSAVVTDLKDQVIKMLQESGLQNFKVPGIATVSLVNKLSVKTPKTHEEKEKFFAWLKSQGDDMYLQYATVNANSLNSLFKMKQEEAAENGEVLEIPGLDSPSAYSTLSLKK